MIHDGNAIPGFDSLEWINCSTDSSDDETLEEKEKPEMSVNQWLALVTLVILAAGAGLGVGIPLAVRSGYSLYSLSERLRVVERILTEVPLIDGHNDLPWNLRKFVHNQLSKVDLTKDLSLVEPWSHSAWSQTDLNRMRKGNVGAQFWSAYVPCHVHPLNVVQQTLEQIDVIKRMVYNYPKHLEFVTSVTGIKQAHVAGRIASLIGLEGGHSIDNSLGVLRMMYDLGVRYMTLTHTCNTMWAESASGNASSTKRGLTEFGKSVVLEMNRLGMMVDLSHVSVNTMRDALQVSKAPVMFTHSGAKFLCNHSRNIPDDILKKLAVNKGIAMVPFYTVFLACKRNARLKDVVDHIKYIRRVAGVDHVGIGSDFDGIDSAPVGLEDVSKYSFLLAELLRDPSWTEEDIKKVAGLNLLRVFKKVEMVRDEIGKSGQLPREDKLQDNLKPVTHNCSNGPMS